jgi:inner membrane protein
LDSITHIALGAIVGEILLGKPIGKKAMILGAIANSFPDIDFLASLWLSPTDNLLAHRGFTHSILCAALLSLLFSWIASKWYSKEPVSFTAWLLFFSCQLMLHLFVDAFNAYGVGWFIPFSDTRISFHSIFVVDPFYSGILGIVLLLLIVLRPHQKYRARLAAMGLLISSMYLGYALINKYLVSEEIKYLLGKQGITYKRYFITPTPLNTWLWFVVAEVDSGFQIGYRSVFDKTEPMPLTYVPKNEKLLQQYGNDRPLARLKKFSQGYYTAEFQSDRLVFNDLRFGQITGWYHPKAKFTFHYYLNFPDDNLLVLQRGRFTNWNKETVQSLVSRIQGYQTKPHEK